MDREVFISRFWNKVCVGANSECWVWQGGVCKWGFPYCGFKYPDGKREQMAHRVSWYLYFGVRPDKDKKITRICGNHACVNPHHLQALRKKVPLEERFWSKVDVRADDECWDYLGAKNNSGYGLFGAMENEIPAGRAHRVAYYLTYGDFDRSFYVCHRCDDPGCVNPDHLFLGTASDNKQDCAQKNRATSCKQKLTVDEVYLIRAWHRLGFKPRELSGIFGVTKQNVISIVTWSSWKYV